MITYHALCLSHLHFQTVLQDNLYHSLDKVHSLKREKFIISMLSDENTLGV